MGPRAGDDEEERGQQWGIPEATVPDQNGMGKLTFQNLCYFLMHASCLFETNQLIYVLFLLQCRQYIPLCTCFECLTCFKR